MRKSYDYRYEPMDTNSEHIIIKYAYNLKETGYADIGNFEKDMGEINPKFQDYNECRRELERATVQCITSYEIEYIKKLYHLFYPVKGQ
ncbi:MULTISPECIES: hypothetical protein [Clostridium]|uniref:hypothetical protein n=1 Tax=Clostridium TaxID=1485 RepID=UPI00082659D9|nr:MULTISPECIES: hypothetical protein [Clostridium]PJI09965.1 hypothetical protein CUB90_19750 [Clostridium sp. CT7]